MHRLAFAGNVVDNERRRTREGEPHVPPASRLPWRAAGCQPPLGAPCPVPGFEGRHGTLHYDARGHRGLTPKRRRNISMRQQHPKPRRRVGAAAVIPEHRAEGADHGIVSHPDGWYWISTDGHQQFGPFESSEEARADRDRDEELGPALELAEAEGAIGGNDWIDPENGLPGEGRHVPHFDNGDGGSY